MLSTTKTKLQYPYLLAAVAILVLALGTAAYGAGVIPRFSTTEPARQDLSTLSAAQASAYRYTAMAKYYQEQGGQTVDLTTLNAAEATTYRYTSMAQYYAEQGIQQEAVATQDRTDFISRHVEANMSVHAVGMSDYYFRHSEQSRTTRYGPPGR